MAKKKQISLIGRLEHAAGDVADALSVAATGSQVGVLELAAEDELGIRPVKPRKKKVAARKRVAVKKVAKRPAKKVKAKKATKRR